MKNCMFCQHIDIDQGGCGSSWTGCWSGSVRCKRSHDLGYVSDRTVIEIENIGRFVLIAMECPDYKLHDEITDLINKKPLANCSEGV